MPEASEPADGDAARPRVDANATIFEIAARQHGVVSRSQLLRAGVPRHAVEYRLKKGSLRAVHRSVYLTGPVTGRHAREMAAVLACGERAVLSHRTAAAVWELIPPRKRQALVEVTGPRSLRGRRGVRVHRVGRLDPDDICHMHGLPLTTPARTLLDLASLTGSCELERALARAQRQGSVTRDAIEVVLARDPHRRGGPALRALLDSVGGPALTRSKAEARFLALVRKGAIPRPRANLTVEGIEVDFAWPERRLVVEIDGFAYHADRAAFERDRRRDAMLTAAGYRVIRFTWRELTERPETVLVRLAQALAWRAGARSPADPR